MTYSWAVNRLKEDRAITEAQDLEKAGKGKADEETIKAIYIRLGGLVRESDAEPNEKGEPQIIVSNVRGSKVTKVKKPR